MSALGYRARRDDVPLLRRGILLQDNERSYKAKLDNVVTPVILPKSQCDFMEERKTPDGKPDGTFEIPMWLARKEGIL